MTTPDEALESAHEAVGLAEDALSRANRAFEEAQDAMYAAQDARLIAEDGLSDVREEVDTLRRALRELADDPHNTASSALRASQILDGVL